MQRQASAPQYLHVRAGVVAEAGERAERREGEAGQDGQRLRESDHRTVESLVRGLANREIATTLSISENTVEFHLRHVYDKLYVRSRSELLSRHFRDTYWPGTDS